LAQAAHRDTASEHETVACPFSTFCPAVERVDGKAVEEREGVRDLGRGGFETDPCA
jgi:hypothetical protein